MNRLNEQLRLAATIGGLEERARQQQLDPSELVEELVQHTRSGGAFFALAVGDESVAAWTVGLDDQRVRNLLDGRVEPQAFEEIDCEPVASIGDLAERVGGPMVELESDLMTRLGVGHALRVRLPQGSLTLCRLAPSEPFPRWHLDVFSALLSELGVAAELLALRHESSSAVLHTVDPPRVDDTGLTRVPASCPVPLMLLDQQAAVLSGNPAAARKLDLGDPPTLPAWLATVVANRLGELQSAGGIPDGVSGDYQFVQPSGRRVMRVGLVPLEGRSGDEGWLLSVEHGGPVVEERLAAMRDRFSLNKREFEVLELLVDGLKNATIAEILDIKEPTVKYRLTKLMEKTNTETRTELLATVYSSLPT